MGSNDISNTMSATAGGTTAPTQTVSQWLDQRIQNSRKETEKLCVLKAKAEASGILEFPARFLCDIVYA